MSTHSNPPAPGDRTRKLLPKLRSKLRPWIEPGRLARVLAVIVLLSLAAMVPGRTPIGTVWADEGTFLAMMQSLVDDGDLRFDERDAARAEVAEGGRGHLILQRAGTGVAYSKPVVFPLLASPFYALAGEAGPIVFNLLAMGLALWVAWRFLRDLATRHGDPRGLADLALVSFAGASVVVPQAFWRMADSLQCSLAILGFCLIFGAREIGAEPARGVFGWRGAPWLGAVLLAVLVPLRVSNGLLALVPVGVAVADRKWRRAAGMLVLVGGSVLALQAVTVGFTGAENPYRAVRATFTPETGYPAGSDSDRVMPLFEEHRASHLTRLDHPGMAGQVLYSALYFWVGRHTGFFVYFPASILLLWLALRRSDLAGKVAVAAFLGSVAFYVGWKPGNYFGGDTFLGNRYLLPAYPALLVTLRRLPPVRSWIMVWMVAGLMLGSAAVSIVRCDQLGKGLDGSLGPDLCRGSQNHAYAGVFRLLPWESTSQGIEGTRDRYWAGEFLRFVDPWTDVRRNSFVLDAHRPRAEMLVAHWRRAEVQMLRVRTPAAQATLLVDQGGSRQRFEIGRDGADAQAGAWHQIAVASRRSWRRHRFWFNDAPYWVVPYRLGIESPGEDATAELFFVGDPVSLERAFAYEVLSNNWPARPLRLTLRNTSALAWEDDDPVPVTLRWRLLRPAEGGHPEHQLAASEPILLPRSVEPGEEIDLEVPVAWPKAPGNYVVEVDLVMEQVAWFSAKVGSPVLRQGFEVKEPEPAAAAAGSEAPRDRLRPD